MSMTAYEDRGPDPTWGKPEWLARPCGLCKGVYRRMGHFVYFRTLGTHKTTWLEAALVSRLRPVSVTV